MKIIRKTVACTHALGCVRRRSYTRELSLSVFTCMYSPGVPLCSAGSQCFTGLQKRVGEGLLRLCTLLLQHHDCRYGHLPARQTHAATTPPTNSTTHTVPTTINTTVELLVASASATREKNTSNTRQKLFSSGIPEIFPPQNTIFAKKIADFQEQNHVKFLILEAIIKHFGKNLHLFTQSKWLIISKIY